MSGKPVRQGAAAAAHVVADQGEVAAFVADPATYGPAVQEVARFDTHGAMVFLAGDRAYKIKRAVRFPYMDFSTLALRRAACEKELRLNRRTAPDLYLETRPILRRPDGGLSFGDTDTAPDRVVEWVLVMRRFDQDGLFDRLAESGRLTPELMRDVTDALRRFHDAAERLGPGESDGGGLGGARYAVEETLEEFAERPDLFPPAEVAALGDRVQKELTKQGPALEARFAAGFVRRCHGDLHLRNLCLIDGRPTLFDGIEFNEAFSGIDVFYDLAFLLMDLDRRAEEKPALRPLANLVLNRYLQDGADLEGLALLPLFLATRALIRAKVAASAEASQATAEAGQRLRTEALGYFRAGQRYLAPAPPRLIAVGGLSGSGKTTLARRLAPLIGAAPGALHLRSDTIRKQLWGAAELARLPEAAYSEDFGRRVYGEVMARACRALEAGHSVVADAVFARPAERQAVAALASDLELDFDGLWLTAAPETLFARVASRRGDASDADAEVVRRQLSFDGCPGDSANSDWPKLEAGGTGQDTLGAAAMHLGVDGAAK